METNKVYHFSAPGRTEICGNHTDHQHGCVLAGAVDLETVAEVKLNNTNKIHFISEGYDPVVIELGDFEIKDSEKNSTAALVRGMISAYHQRGAKLQGFNALVHSTVLLGSGLSSSAAFEVLVGTILNKLFFDGKLSSVEIAQIGQYAENVYFGKPCGLMDQTASSVGGLVYIDFADPKNPLVKKLDFDFTHSGYALCIIDSGANHADLTDEYAAIPKDMCAVADAMGKEFLRDADEDEFYDRLPDIRKVTGDRAVLRAMHFFDENRRVQAMVNALENDHFDMFLNFVNMSGESSWKLLQNITPVGCIHHQDIAVGLAVAKRLLSGRGAVRIHGGGFAGTIQTFVPMDMLSKFKNSIEEVLGKGHCHVLSIRSEGGVMR